MDLSQGIAIATPVMGSMILGPGIILIAQTLRRISMIPARDANTQSQNI